MSSTPAARAPGDGAAGAVPLPVGGIIAPGPTYTLRRLWPWGLVLLLSLLSPAIPHAMTPIAKWWITAGAVFLLLVGACAGAARLPNGHWSHTVAPLVVFPLVQLLRAADGFASSGFSPLLVLPVIWFALYGRRRDVIISLVLAANVLIWPVVVIGAPRYPATTLRGSILLLTVLTALGLLLSQLVRTAGVAITELSRSEQQFRATFEDAPVGMALRAIEGPRAGYFLRVNRALCLLLGRSAEELTSAPIATWTHPDDIQQTEWWSSTAADPNAAHRYEKRYLHRSGRVVWTSVSYSAVRDENGRPVHLICQIEDVSARRQADQALLAALDSERDITERMRELEQVRTAVMSDAAHDLRTPLTSATGFAEVLLDGAAGPLSGVQRGMVETVSRSLARLNGIVDELVKTARTPASSHSAIAKQPVDLGAALDAATQAMTIMSSLASQTFEVDNRLAGVLIDGEPDRLDRALSNLLSNAVKFTPSGGTVQVCGEVQGDRAVVRVIDDGIGIPEEDHERIFERYYRSPGADGRAINGSGLGLAIVKEIISQHQGTITVGSRPGEGSTFTVTLPLAR